MLNHVIIITGGLKKSRLLHHHGGGGGGGGVAGGLAQGLQQYVGQQLVVPLLLSLISKIAALGPPIMAGVLGIFLLVLFAKKAFLFSFFALLVALSQKTKNDDHEIYIKKVNTYPHYNKEENEVHFHKLPLKYSKYYHRRHRRMRI